MCDRFADFYASFYIFFLIFMKLQLDIIVSVCVIIPIHILTYSSKFLYYFGVVFALTMGSNDMNSLSDVKMAESDKLISKKEGLGGDVVGTFVLIGPDVLEEADHEELRDDFESQLKVR